MAEEWASALLIANEIKYLILPLKNGMHLMIFHIFQEPTSARAISNVKEEPEEENWETVYVLHLIILPLKCSYTLSVQLPVEGVQIL